jgi:hypothetical protein
LIKKISSKEKEKNQTEEERMFTWLEYYEIARMLATSSVISVILSVEESIGTYVLNSAKFPFRNNSAGESIRIIT